MYRKTGICFRSACFLLLNSSVPFLTVCHKITAFYPTSIDLRDFFAYSEGAAGQGVIASQQGSFS